VARVRIVLSGLWVSLMLTYLLGDVLRLFAGDITPGEIDGASATQAVWLGAAAIMLVPIIMVVLSLTLPYPAICWVARKLSHSRELRLQWTHHFVRLDVDVRHSPG
jgi:hypothetical protein